MGSQRVGATSPARRIIAGAACAALITIATSACSESDSGSADSQLDQVAPTRDDVAAAANIDFPPSTEGFRLVRTSPQQVDITFTIDSSQVSELTEGSDLALDSSERVLVHASPLWDVAVTDELRSGSSMHEGIRRSIEVIEAEDQATVRLSLFLAGDDTIDN